MSPLRLGLVLFYAWYQQPVYLATTTIRQGAFQDLIIPLSCKRKLYVAENDKTIFQ